jgi:hypothetical protein
MLNKVAKTEVNICHAREVLVLHSTLNIRNLQ